MSVSANRISYIGITSGRVGVVRSLRAAGSGCVTGVVPCVFTTEVDRLVRSLRAISSPRVQFLEPAFERLAVDLAA
ncbi:hypothetical protein [Natronorubrum sp. DTA7]|uniref:hypothetical protein n=1 Tax=Natronorubrum sp. DTA7 TaxID=3447016 RepID=UPI003F87789A